MKITIGIKQNLSEQQKAFIYEVHCRFKMEKGINRENLKTDVRAIKGVTTVTTVPGTEEPSGTYSHQILKIKFRPYQTSPGDFLKKMSDSLRQLSGRGLVTHNFLIRTLKRVEI
jgi:hypothetical protein